MAVDEVCPDCGAERLSWVGGSHWQNVCEDLRRKCEDSQSADEAWMTGIYGAMAFPRHWDAS